MKREEMRSILDLELSHIPRSYKGSPQNAFRLYYYFFRRTDLAKTKRGKDPILEKAIEETKKQYRDFLPEYDKNFFKL